jgi:hypothetical protein
MGNIKYKDEMELIYMLIDLTGIRNFREHFPFHSFPLFVP